MKEKISVLNRNYNIYPREELDKYNVIRLRNAIEAGAELPPVIVDTKTKMVIDGFHRIEVIRLISGPDGEIEVEYRDYNNLGEMFIDAVRCNSIQGQTLSPEDIERTFEVAKVLDVRPAYLASALSMTAARVKSFDASRIDASISLQDPGIQRARSVDTAVVEPAPYIKFKPNKSHRFYIRQVLKMFKENTVDMTDADLIDMLTELYLILKEIYK